MKKKFDQHLARVSIFSLSAHGDSFYNLIIEGIKLLKAKIKELRL